MNYLASTPVETLSETTYKFKWACTDLYSVMHGTYMVVPISSCVLSLPSGLQLPPESSMAEEEGKGGLARVAASTSSPLCARRR